MRSAVVLFVLLVMAMSQVSWSGVPRTISYQGVLRDEHGALLDGDYEVIFRLYNSEVGGDSLWTEMIYPVHVESGIFNVILGDTEPLALPFDQTYWLSVEVEHGGELEPRVQFTTSPYAFRAGIADSVRGGGGGIVGGILDIQKVGSGSTAPRVKVKGYRNDQLAGAYLLLGKSRGSLIGQELMTFPGDTLGEIDGFGISPLFTEGVAGRIIFLQTGESPDSLVPGAILFNTCDGNRPAAERMRIGASGDVLIYEDVSIGGYLNMNNNKIGSLADPDFDNEAATRGWVDDRFIRGNGVSNAIAKFQDSQTITDSGIYESNGKVSIGSSSTDTTLDVTGTAKMEGFKMPTGASDGYVLTSNSYGVGTWQEASGGSGSGDITAIYAEDGLTGDALEGAAYLNVGAGNGIDVSADAVAVDVTDFAGDGLGEDASNNLVVNVGTGLEVISDAVQLIGEYQTGSIYDVRFLNCDQQEVMSVSNNDFALKVENTGNGNAVEGYTQGGGHAGLYGKNTGSGVGVEAYSSDGDAVHAVTSSTDLGAALYGRASGEYGTNYGVWAVSESGAGYAGYFVGDVEVTGNLTKSAGSFKIDHPLDPTNKYLCHSSVESPDMMNIYNGNVTLDAVGEAWIELPEWFEALNHDFRYQLTCIGGFAPVYVAERIAGNRFKIAGGEPGLEVSWQVTGIRHDLFAEKYRMLVEEDKPDGERGKYLCPELYGMPRTMGVNYKEVNRSMK
jgi:hypothetical protein